MFSGVDTMFFWENTLELDVILGESILEVLKTFVVEDVEIGRMVVAHEEFVCLFPCIANAHSLAIGSGNGVNRIGVLMIDEDKSIIIPPTTGGGDVEMTSRLIGVGLQERLIVEEQNSNLMGARLKSCEATLTLRSEASTGRGSKQVEQFFWPLHLDGRV